MKAAFITANLIIFFGYLVVSGFIMPRVNLKKWSTRISGVLFFFTCGLTHLELAYHTNSTWDDYWNSWHMLINHSIQAIAVIVFIHGLYTELLAHDREVWTRSIDINIDGLGEKDK